MRFTSYLEDKRLTVALTGEIDHHCAKRYMAAIISKIEIYCPKICILDFQDVSFMDSSGIAVAINAMRSMQKIGGKLILERLKPQPLKVILASGIDKLIEIREVAV
jgi:stage II sporulation protein AA (anti-sigma F factor antagonist)